jgi:hypothetical protein
MPRRLSGNAATISHGHETEPLSKIWKHGQTFKNELQRRLKFDQGRGQTR